MPVEEVSVRTAQGTTIIELSPSHTVLQLKKDLEREGEPFPVPAILGEIILTILAHSIPVNQQRLLYLGRILIDHELIEDLNVQEHTPIQCFDLGDRSSTPSASSTTTKSSTATKPRLPKAINFAIEVRSQASAIRKGPTYKPTRMR